MAHQRLQSRDGLRVPGRVGGFDQRQEFAEFLLHDLGVSSGAAEHELDESHSRGGRGCVSTDRLRRERASRLALLPTSREPAHRGRHEPAELVRDGAVHVLQLSLARVVERHWIRDWKEAIEKPRTVIAAEQLHADRADDESGSIGQRQVEMMSKGQPIDGERGPRRKRGIGTGARCH